MKRLIVFSLATVFLAGCGFFDSSGPSDGIQPKAGSVDIHKNGAAASLYIIGSCDGSDNPGNNVISFESQQLNQTLSFELRKQILIAGKLVMKKNVVDSRQSYNRVLKSPGNCPGSPFDISASKVDANTVRVTVFIGPAVTDYKTMSIPLDTMGKVSDRFSFAVNGYYVGCGYSWSFRPGPGDSFSSIPQPCNIEGAGPVGAARTGGYASWAEISGPRLKISRETVGGSCTEYLAHNHPHTNNLEKGFGSISRDRDIILRRGGQLSCEEYIHIE